MIDVLPRERPFFLGSNLISWWFRKQQVTARFSTKNEYKSLARSSTELRWLPTSFTELQVSLTNPILLCDNQSAFYCSQSGASQWH